MIIGSYTLNPAYNIYIKPRSNQPMIERAEQDLRREITSLRESSLNGRSLAPMADAMQGALYAALNPAPPAKEEKAPAKAEPKRGK